jgi:hypothetical protein
VLVVVRAVRKHRRRDAVEPEPDSLVG